MRKILFILHEASRTGAPAVLLSLMEKIKSENCYQFDLLIVNENIDAEVLASFQKLTPNIFVWNRRKKTIFRKIFDKLFPEKLQQSYNQKLLKLLKKNNYSLIYANSVASSRESLILKNHLSIPVILHMHELETLINRIIGHDTFAKMIPEFDYFIVVSYAVKDNLINNYGVLSQKIVLAYPFSANLDAEITLASDDIREQLGISDKTFVIGSAGTVYGIKGFDIFILLAKYFYLNYPEIDCIFTWVGNIPKNEQMQVDCDLKKLNLTDKVKFIGEKSNPVDYFNMYDVFVLTSREDSFPLVCVESATRSKPIVCFDKSGGMVEFVATDAGFVVPYLNIEAMAEKIFLLLQDEDLRRKMGATAKEKATTQYSKDISIKTILDVIDSVCKKKN